MTNLREIVVMCLRYLWFMIISRGRHPGQGPRDPAVPVPEIWDRDSFYGTKRTAGIRGIPQKIRDRDAKSELPEFGTGTQN